MQHQSRTISANLLARTEEQCRLWQKHHATSVSLVSSLSNNLAQQAAALEHCDSLAQHGVDAHRLVYKQMLVFEKTMSQLTHVMDALKGVVVDLRRIESDSKKHLAKAAPAAVVPAQLSSEALLQVAAIRPHEVLDYVSAIVYMYETELAYKQTLFHALPEYAASNKFDDLVLQWQTQSHIQWHVQDEMSERLRLYKQSKKFIESKD